MQRELVSTFQLGEDNNTIKKEFLSTYLQAQNPF